MAELAVQMTPEKQVTEPTKESLSDEGVDRAVARLTPEKINRVIDQVLNNECGARFRAYIDTCAHCGLCSNACHYYLSSPEPDIPYH